MAVNEQINSNSIDDWELIVNVSRSLLQGEKQIPKLTLDVSLNSNFIAVEVLTSNSQPNWVAGGYIAQTYKLDALNLTSQQHFITINQVNFLELKQIASFNFGLTYNPPKYFKDVRLKIWKYQGIQTNLLLQNIANALPGGGAPDLPGGAVNIALGGSPVLFGGGAAPTNNSSNLRFT